MSLASFGFLVFLACLLALYFAVPMRARWGVLLAASYVYIALNSPWTALFLLLATGAVFGAALRIEGTQQAYAAALKANRASWSAEERKARKQTCQRQKRRWLTAALVFVFGLLVTLKYGNFLIRNANGVLGLFGVGAVPEVNWLLPLGISFYTLQVSGYLIDIYRGKYAADRHFLKFALFTSWFPQLVQGPISRYDALAGQLVQGHAFDWRRFKSGALRMLWGYAKKLIIADRLSIVVNFIFPRFTQGYFGAYIWVAVLMYSFQIYADFSGGMDIVLGLSEMLGIRMTENFRRPMLATSVAEFWQRWHITLGSWMRDYLFYPLALSSRFGRLAKRLRKRFGPYVAKVAPAVLASFIVFTCVGVWHGAEWKYVVYGCYQAIFVSSATLLEPFYASMRKRLHVREESRWFRGFRVLRTFGIIMVGRVLSRCDTLGNALRMLKGAVQTWNPQVLWDGSLLNVRITGAEWVLLAVAIALWMAVDLLNERGVTVRDELEKRALPLRWAVYILGTMAVLIFGVYGAGFDAGSFIYGGF